MKSIHLDASNRWEAFEAEEAGKPVIVKVYTSSSLGKVEQLLKSAIHLCKLSSLLPGPLRTLQVSKHKTEYQTQWVMDRRKDRTIEELVQSDVWPKLTVGLEAYEVGQSIYAKTENVSRVCVLEGKELKLGRPVVVKLYECEYTELTKVVHEALLQGKAESLHTCKLLDCSIRKGNRSQLEVGLVMEKLEGDLGQQIKRRDVQQSPFSEKELAQVLVEISDALMFAKWMGIAHRDIKPANVFVDQGHYRLGDFGSACEVGEIDICPDGTLAYVSPEMRHWLLGETVEVNAYQSDVFSLGVTLLHLAKLRLPDSIPGAWLSSMELKEAVEKEIQGLPYTCLLLDLIKRMLQMKPQKRPVLEELYLKALILLQKPEEGFENWQSTGNINSEVFETCDLSNIARTAYQIYSQGNIVEAKLTILKLLCKNRSFEHKALGKIYTFLGFIHFFQHRFTEGHKLLEAGWLLASASTEVTLEMLRIEYCVAKGCLCEGKLLEAQTLLKRILDKLTKTFSEPPSLISEIILWLGIAYELQWKPAEAEEMLLQNLNLRIRHAEESRTIALSLYALADIYILTGRRALAETIIHKSIEVGAKLYDEEHPEIIMHIINLGDCYYRQGKYGEAEDLYLATLERFAPVLGINHSYILACMVSLAEIYDATERESESLELRKACLDISIQQFGDESLFTVFYHYEFAKSLLNVDRLTEAEEYFTKVLNANIRLLGQNNMIVMFSYMQLGKVLYLQGRLEQASTLLKSTLDFSRQVSEIDSELTAECADVLGSVYLRQGRAILAEKLHLNSFEIYFKVYGEAHPSTLLALSHLAEDYLEEGRLLEAHSLLQTVTRIHVQLHRNHPKDIRRILAKLT